MRILSICSVAVFSCLLLTSPVRAEVMNILSPTIFDIFEEDQLSISTDQKKKLLDGGLLSQIHTAFDVLDRRILMGEVDANHYILEMDSYDNIVIGKFEDELNQSQLQSLSSMIWDRIGAFSFLSRAYSEVALGDAIKTREYHKMRYQALEGLIKLHKDLASRRFVNADAKDKYVADALLKIEEYIKATIAKKEYWR